MFKMEEEGDGIRQSQECVILVMIEMISAGTVDNVADAIIMINDETSFNIHVKVMIKSKH